MNNWIKLCIKYEPLNTAKCQLTSYCMYETFITLLADHMFIIVLTLVDSLAWPMFHDLPEKEKNSRQKEDEKDHKQGGAVSYVYLRVVQRICMRGILENTRLSTVLTIHFPWYYCCRTIYLAGNCTKDISVTLCR